MAKGEELQERLILFAARVIKVCAALPRSATGRHIGRQLLRAGTAPAPHHSEARSAESTADFIHKLKMAVKELNETEVWLRILVASKLIRESQVSDLLDECKQLQRIISASIRTARERAQSKPTHTQFVDS